MATKKQQPEPAQDPNAPGEYRFVGSDTEITGVGRRFTEFGEKATLTPEDAASGPFIPEADFAAIGFTEEELKNFSNPADHEQFDIETRTMVAYAPPEFLEKKRKALAVLHERNNPAGAPVPESAGAVLTPPEPVQQENV